MYKQPTHTPTDSRWYADIAVGLLTDARLVDPVLITLEILGARRHGYSWIDIAAGLHLMRRHLEGRRRDRAALGAELALTVAEYRLAHPAMTADDVAAAIGAMRSMLVDDGDLLA